MLINQFKPIIKCHGGMPGARCRSPNHQHMASPQAQGHSQPSSGYKQNTVELSKTSESPNSPCSEKEQIPYRKCGKSGTKSVSGSGANFTENVITRLAQKLRRIILLHLGFVTFRFHCGKTKQYRGILDLSWSLGILKLWNFGLPNAYNI